MALINYLLNSPATGIAKYSFMRKIYAIGESLLDIIFKNNLPQTAKPGGAMLNSVISVGRMGLPVYFISEYGIDDAGDLIDSFLSANGVNTSYVGRYNDGNTALALAFLDHKNDANYTFYKNRSSRQLNTGFPLIEKNDIILCGSFYSIWSEIRESFKAFISESREKGAMIIYDPNFRKSHISELSDLKPMIIENMKMADIVRGSDEDFETIFAAESADDAYEALRDYCPLMVYTANTRGIYVKTPSFSGMFPVKKITPVSTIGAGDNFNAGMITSIYQNDIRADQLGNLTEKEWEKVISTAVEFATNVCLSYENYISEKFANELKNRKVI